MPETPVKSRRNELRAQGRVGVIGVPFSKGQRKAGTEDAPKLLRESGLMEKLADVGCDAVDRGDVAFETINNDTTVNNVNNPRTIASASNKIADKVERVLKEDGHCLAIGGDHSMSIGTILGHARVEPSVVILWIDAHADINTPLTSDSGNVHGMPLSFLVKELSEYMPTLPGFANIKPCLTTASVAWIGLRDVDKGERKIIEEYGMAAFSMQEVDKYGISEVVAMALKAVDPSGSRPIHLSFDVDSMDPALTPSTGTPVIAGLSLRESFYIAEEVASTGRLSMVDIAEVNPRLGNSSDVSNTVDMTLDVIQRFYGNRRRGVCPRGYDIPKPEHEIGSR